MEITSFAVKQGMVSATQEWFGHIKVCDSFDTYLIGFIALKLIRTFQEIKEKAF